MLISMFCLSGLLRPLWAQDAGSLDNPVARAFPLASSKKGLQVQMVDDALNLGVQHAAINLNLSQLIDPVGQPQNPFWERDGKKFCFRSDYLASLERQIKPLSDRNVLVYMIMLVYASDSPDVNRLLVHPQYDPASRNRVAAWNVQTQEGRDWLTAAFSFLARRWSRPEQPHGRVVGYIIGNEVNSHHAWANRGDVTANEFIDEYLTTVRLAADAVHAQAESPRIYLSLDHFWGRAFNNNPLRTIAGKDLIDRFAYRARQTGDFDWHVAYHPYPENLFQAAFWNDHTALATEQTPRITFKNLEVLTSYLQRDELLYQGRPRRVILSEQGFHSDNTPESLQLQAAAYCLAWKKVESLPGIDAFIYHRHVDHAQEGGLNLGLWGRAPGSTATPLWKKPIHKVFLSAGTPNEQDAFKFALPLVGHPDWDSALQALRN